MLEFEGADGVRSSLSNDRILSVDGVNLIVGYLIFLYKFWQLSQTPPFYLLQRLFLQVDAQRCEKSSAHRATHSALSPSASDNKENRNPNDVYADKNSYVCLSAGNDLISLTEKCIKFLNKIFRVSHSRSTFTRHKSSGALRDNKHIYAPLKTFSRFSICSGDLPLGSEVEVCRCFNL